MVAALETRTRSSPRLKLVSSPSERRAARDHILGSWLSQRLRDFRISPLIMRATAKNASKAFSAGGCGSLKFSCSLDASIHASENPDGLQVDWYHLPMRVAVDNKQQGVSRSPAGFNLCLGRMAALISLSLLACGVRVPRAVYRMITGEVHRNHR